MFGERRRDQRVAIKRVARIEAQIGGMQSIRECTVINLSDSGARLFVEDGDIPDNFSLLIIAENTTRHECKVVWRLGGELGVEFVNLQADQSRINSFNRVREDARKIFQDPGRAN
jgi:hypothetical protein